VQLALFSTESNYKALLNSSLKPLLLAGFVAIAHHDGTLIKGKKIVFSLIN